MNDKRRLPRKRPNTTLHVVDAMTDAVVGRIGDLSLGGMMLLADRAFRDDALFQFVFHLSDARGIQTPIEVGVRELWNDTASVPGQNWVGFRFIDISVDAIACLNTWLAYSEPQQP
ncbi:MAG: PilZ domain-containing protein [Dokdonella sp.]